MRRLAAWERSASFDCYGTLIDWNGGVRVESARVFGDERADDLLVRYHEVEPDLQGVRETSYRQVLTGPRGRAGLAGPGGAVRVGQQRTGRPTTSSSRSRPARSARSSSPSVSVGQRVVAQRVEPDVVRVRDAAQVGPVACRSARLARRARAARPSRPHARPPARR